MARRPRRHRSRSSASSRRVPYRWSGWRPARWASSSPASRTSARCTSATPSPMRASRRVKPLAGFRDAKPMVFAGLYPIDASTSTARCATRSRSSRSTTRRSPTSRHLPGARLRLPLRLPRPAPHGDRAGAAGARVRPRADHDRARRSPTACSPPPARWSRSKTRRSSPTPAASRRSRSRSSSRRSSRPTRTSAACCAWCENRRGEQVKMEYLGGQRVLLEYRLPLAEVVLDFYDKLKSVSRGYASFDYQLVGLPRGRPGQARPAGERRARSTRSP